MKGPGYQCAGVLGLRVVWLVDGGGGGVAPQGGRGLLGEVEGMVGLPGGGVHVG